MSNYHVRTISKDGRSAKVVFHLPIPVENNNAGISLRTALSESIQRQNEDGSWIIYNSVLNGILSEELTQIRAGELYEVFETVKFLSADTNGQKQTKIDNRYTVLTTRTLEEIRAILKFWGLNRDTT